MREFLARVLPSAADHLAAEADQLLASGKVDEAEARYRHVLEEDSRNGLALVGLARLLTDRRDDAAALELLERVLPGPSRQAADRLAAEIRVRQGGSGDEDSLRARVVAHPDDLEARVLLAQALARVGKYSDALGEYLEIVRRDRTFRDGEARKAMLDIFELLGARHETTEHYRSELAKILFAKRSASGCYVPGIGTNVFSGAVGAWHIGSPGRAGTDLVAALRVQPPYERHTRAQLTSCNRVDHLLNTSVERDADA